MSYSQSQSQTEKDVFTICYYRYAIVVNRLTDRQLVWMLESNFLLALDAANVPRKFNMKKLLPLLSYHKAYLSLEYIIKKFKPVITYWHKFDFYSRNKNFSKHDLYKFLDIYTRHCIIRKFRQLTYIFDYCWDQWPERYYNQSAKLHTGKLLKYCKLYAGDRTNPAIIELIKLRTSYDDFNQSLRYAWLTGCLVLE